MGENRYFKLWTNIIVNSLSQLLEKVMYSRLNQHKHANNIITPEQFGFRKDRKMEIAICTLTDYILKALDECSQTLGIFL
jgi:hypothetical protein